MHASYLFLLAAVVLPNFLFVTLYYQVCKEAGFGVSLFKRLSLLGFKKHLLNVQYRMNPRISLFPNAWFYDRMITDSSNVKSPSYNKDYLDLPFGTYTFLNIVDGEEEREVSGSSWRNMVEVAVILQLIKSIFKCMYLGFYVWLLFYLLMLHCEL